MTNYFKDSKLVKCNSKYEVYSFEIVNDLFEIFISNSINQIDIDFGHNIISIPDSKNSVFSLSTDKCHSNEILINVDRNNNLLNNLGKLKERIIVKENYQLNSNNKRKVNSNQVSNYEIPAKKLLVEQKVDSDNDVGSILSTQSRTVTSFSMKTKIGILDELKLGRSMRHISYAFNISENKIKEFLSKESEIRRQYKEATIDRGELSNSSTQPPIVKQNKLMKSNPKSTDKLNKSQPNLQKMSEKSPIDDLSKCELNSDFRLTKENGRLVFSDSLKKATSVDLRNFAFQLPKDYPDIPKSDPPPNQPNPKRASIANPVKKPSTNHGNSLSNSQFPFIEKGAKNSLETITSIVQESKKPLQFEKKPPQLEKKPTNIAEPTNKRADKDTDLAVDKDIRISKHYPTDPITKIKQNHPMTKAKSSTNQYKPPNISSPFRYIVVDPRAIDFVPSERVDPELKSTNVDSEDFIDEVQKLYERFTECAKIYDKYRLKRDDLRNRVSNIKSEKEISELHKDIYRLVEEEKRPFFMDLEKEVTILQSKLTKVADLLGIKLNL